MLVPGSSVREHTQAEHHAILQPPWEYRVADFPTTHWSFITALQQADDASQRRMLGAFLVRYLPVFRRHLAERYPKIDEHTREDLIQGFVTDRLLERRILERVAESKGRLRSFLRVCLNNFVNSMLRKVKPDERVTGQPYAIDEQVMIEESGVTSFDVAWADQLLTEAILNMKDSCFESGRQVIWEVLDFRVLRPAFLGSDPLTTAELSEKLGVDADKIANRLVTAKRMLKRHLEDAIREYAVSINEVDAELQDLVRIFTAAGSERSPRIQIGSQG